ncbi:retrotransposon protein, putative, ty1-copia subclass, partial [Tanacetum coccineum]
GLAIHMLTEKKYPLSQEMLTKLLSRKLEVDHESSHAFELIRTPPPPKKDNPAKDAICHQCGEVGHWRRNCPVYLAELMKKKKLSQGASTLGTTGNSLVSVSRLFDDGFINRFDDNNVISVLKDSLVYFMAVPRNGIFEIDMSCFNTNDSSMYAITNKRANINLDSSLLWHCRLGHISKKCIEKLQHDGLLNSIDIESLGKCVSCLSGKMVRKPYSHQVERAKDLLGLIHTDACGPFRIVSRQGASYFITFTDDFSCYGYVYLLKHKHEVFETFKVFQKEVENQLRKTIKSLRSDRGGEYTSQEFLDHLKVHGIIAHRTPPYTPQHNGVSESRKRTLLDMVRSMMSQTILPKSFWDYALDTAARILNMVPTKKIDKTPYEIWHEQAPKLSYLKV